MIDLIIERPANLIYFIAPSVWLLYWCLLWVAFWLDSLLLFWKVRERFVPVCMWYVSNIFVRPFAESKWSSTFDNTDYAVKVRELHMYTNTFQADAIWRTTYAFYGPLTMLFPIVCIDSPVIFYSITVILFFGIAPRVYNGYIKRKVESNGSNYY